MFGTVVWFSKGYGFIKPDGTDSDIFCHYSDVDCPGFKMLYKGQKVSFMIGQNKRGQPKAIEVKVIYN